MQIEQWMSIRYNDDAKKSCDVNVVSNREMLIDHFVGSDPGTALPCKCFSHSVGLKVECIALPALCDVTLVLNAQTWCPFCSKL